MLSKLIIASAGIAAAIILAPTAAADADDMTNTVAAQSTAQAPSPYQVTIPEAASGGQGAYGAFALSEDCAPVKGRWTEDGFVRDPKGSEVAWVVNGSLKGHPFDDGLSDSSRDMLNTVTAAKKAKEDAAAE